MSTAAVIYAEPEAPVVELKSGLSVKEFFQEYVNPRKPVVLLDAMKGWSTSRWTPDFFRENFGERRVAVARMKEWYTVKFDRFIQHVTKSTAAPHGPSPDPRLFYLRNRCIGTDFAELLPDFKVSEYFLPNWIEQWPLNLLLPFAPNSSAELFIGPPGAMGPYIHRDLHMTHSWISQVFGQKRIWIVSPEQDDCMYQDPARMDHSLVNDFENPDLDKFPLFAQARVATTVLNPGETVFIPAGWWHTAECVTAAISISGNFVNGSNYADFRKSMILPRFRKPGRSMAFLNQNMLRLHGFICAMRGL